MVQNVVLDDEDGIVNHADVAKSKLDRVTGDTAPVALLITIDGLLTDAKDTASKIQ